MKSLLDRKKSLCLGSELGLSVVGGGAVGTYATIPQFTYAPTLIDGFEDYTSWLRVAGSGVLGVDNTTQFSEGSHSMRVSNVGAASSLDKALSFTLGATDHVGIDIYTHVAVESTVSIFLDSGVGSMLTKYIDLEINRLDSHTLFGWQHIDFSPLEATLIGGMTWTTPITRIRVRLNTTTADCSFDNFTHGPASFAPVMVVTWDDQYPGVYANGFPLFKSRFMRSTMYTVTSHLDTVDHMTTAQLMELYADGWTVGNHTRDHVNFTALSDAQIQASVGGAISDLRSAGIAGNGPLHMAYPGGIFNANSATALPAQGILTARLAGGATGNIGIYGYDNRFPNLYMSSQNLDNTVSLATAKARIDSAKARGKGVAFYGHDVQTSAAALTWATADLAALLDYATAQGFYVVSVDDYYKLYSQDVTIRIA